MMRKLLSTIVALTVCASAAAAPKNAPTNIDRLLKEGDEALRQVFLATADKSFREALRVARETKNRRAEADARNGIARIFAGNRWEALAQLRVALAIHRGLKDEKGQASDLARSGEILLLHSSSAKSIRPLSDAVELQRRLGLKKEEAQTRENLAMALQNTGAYEEALTHLSSAFELTQKLEPESFGFVRVSSRLGMLESRLGLYESSADHLQQALDAVAALRSKVPDKTMAEIQNAFARQGGQNLQDMGAMAQAISGMFGEDTKKSNVANDPALIEAARGVFAEDDWGAPPDARPTLPSIPGVGANPYQQTQAHPDPVMFLQFMEPITAFTLESAEKMARETKKNLKSEMGPTAEAILSTPPCEMAIASSLRQIQKILGRESEAAQMHDREWTLMAEQNAFHAKLFSSVGGLANPPLDEFRQKARKLGMSIPPVYLEKCDGALSHAKEALWDADASAAMGNIQQAISQYETAASNPAMRPFALARIAPLEEKRGDKERAVEAYKKAIDAVESMQGSLRLEQLSASWASAQSPLYAGMINVLRGLGRTELAFDYAERARARAFLNQIGNHRLPAAGVPADLATELYDVRQRLFELESAQAAPRKPGPTDGMAAMMGGGDANRSREEESLRRRYEQLLQRLAQANPQYLSLVQIDTVSTRQLQREILPADTTLVEYFLLDDRALAWVIDRNRVQIVDLTISAQEVHSEVGRFRSLIRVRDPETQNAAAKLHGKLFAPLEKHIRNANVIIVPHGPLHYLPFSALWNSAKKRYVIEDYTLQLAPSASALRYLGTEKRGGAGLLALGNPDQSLPNAEREVKDITALHGSSPRIGREARESVLRKEGSGAAIVHLAAHARYDTLRPLFTWIDLAPDEKATDETNDGKLHLYEIYDLDLRATKLAVLSACDTALGRRDEGDAVVGLTRGFLYAGVPAVVATLWSIDDPASAQLMVDFHKRLVKNVPPAQALRAAQLEIIRQTEWRAPYYWAAFTLTGRN